MDVWVVEEYYWNLSDSYVSPISGVFSNEAAAKKFVDECQIRLGHCYFDITKHSVQD